MQNEMNLEQFEVSELCNLEIEKLDGGILLGGGGWLAGAFAALDAVHDAYKGWQARHDEVNKQW